MKTIADSPWDIARRTPVKRDDSFGQGEVELEPGVNFFVLALESIGAETLASCEGHPNHFYISFTAPYETALQVKSWGYFSVEITRNNEWTISLNDHHIKTESDKEEWLRSASEAWSARMRERQPEADGK